MNNNVVKKPTNKIEKLWLKNSTLFIEGLAYIEGHNSPEFSYLNKYLCLINTKAHTIFEYELGSIRRHELKAQNYQGHTYDYTAAGTATKGLKGISISELNDGIYEVLISITATKFDNRMYQDLRLNFDGLDRHSADDYFEYRLFQKNGKTYLTKRNIIGRDVPSGSHVTLTADWAKQTIFHVEGEFIVPGIDITEFNQAKYYLIAKKTITQRQYVFELGQIKKPNLGEKINNPFGGYDACYFATLSLKGINTAQFELGNYDLYVSLAYKSEIFTAKLNKSLEIIQGGVCSLILNDEQ